MIRTYFYLVVIKKGLNCGLVKTFVTHYHTFKTTFTLDLALGYLYKHIVGVPICSNCVNLVADRTNIYFTTKEAEDESLDLVKLA